MTALTFIASAIVTVIPTLTVGYVNGVSAIGVVGMTITGIIMHVRNRAAS